MSIYLIEIEAFNLITRDIETLRFCNGTGFMTQPNDTPPNAFYEPRVANAGLARFDIFSKGSTGGQSTISRGAIELTNTDGGLDYLTGYALDGRRCYVRVGTPGGTYPDDFPISETYTMEVPKLGTSTVSLTVRDKQLDLDNSALTIVYAGDNDLPAGLEGGSDLKGKTKPRPFGRVNNASPPCVNTSRLIYETGATVTNVYDNGAALDYDGTYESQTDMETNAPAVGSYRIWIGGGFIRLGSSPVGSITADILQGATAADRTAGQLSRQLATLSGGISTNDIIADDITLLDADNSAECGLWVNSDNRRTLLDTLGRTVGAWWGFDRLGKFRMSRLELPTGNPVATLTTGLELDNALTLDSETLPVWRVTVRYDRNWTVQTSVAGCVTDERKEWLKNEWRQVTATDADIKTAHPLATELTIDTCYIHESAAQSEADLLLAMYGSQRYRYADRLLDPALFYQMQLGAVVRLVSRRYGLSQGKLVRIIGLQPDYGLGRVDLTMWG